MDAKSEIKNIITRKEINGALLITGKWGCGKSFLMQKIANELNAGSEFTVVFISLFGIDSLATLSHKIKECIFNKKAGLTLSDLNRKKVAKAKSTIATIASSLSDYSSIAKGINAALTVNLYDLVEIEHSITFKQNGDTVIKELILIFDDFERSQINIVERLGAINDLSENKHIKTIIIADEEKISEDDSSDSKYSTYKEKLISCTIRLTPEYSQIIDSIISNYNETTTGYKDYLIKQTKLLIQLFNESQAENIRIFKTVIIDFERIYRVCNNMALSQDILPYIMYSFGAITFEFKAGNYKKGKYGYLFAENEMKKKYMVFNKLGSSLSSLKVLITDGIWSQDELEAEIKKRYCAEALTNVQKFLLYGFWDLQQEQIKIGLPAAVEKAYRGGLCGDELISLFQKVHSLKEYDIELPCEIDYKKIELGLDSRIAKIKKGTIVEPQNRTFTENSQIDAEATELNHRIERMNDLLTSFGNRNKLISYLQHNENISRYDLKGIVLNSFDDDLLTIFLDSYKSCDNSTKRGFSLTLLDLNLSESMYSQLKDIRISIANLNTLIKKLKHLNENEADQMTIVINNHLIKHIEIKISALNQNIEAVGNT